MDKRKFAVPKDRESVYWWDSQSFIRVTHVLDLVPGDHLLPWYAKQGCLESASFLVHAGLFPLKLDTVAEAEIPGWKDLSEYVEATPMRVMSPDEAIAAACNWPSNMRRPERYRDVRGSLGSLAHLYAYDKANGFLGPKLDKVEYLAGKAVKDNRILTPEMAERFASLGKTKDDVATALAYQALQFTNAVDKFFDDYRPEFEAIGLETACFNFEEEYAGRIDKITYVKRSVWDKKGEFEWPFGDTDVAQLAGDYKTSKIWPESTVAQMGAYAACQKIGLYSDFSLHDMPEFHGGLGVHLRPDGGYRLYPYKNEAMEKAYEEYFIPLLTVWRYQHDKPQPEKRVRRKAAPKAKKTDVREVDF